MTLNKYLSLFLAAVILGYAIPSQVKIKSRLAEVIDPQKSRVIALQVNELIKNNRELLQEQKDLQAQKDKLVSAGAAESEQALQEDLDRFKIIAGETAVQGPGVEMKFDKFLQTVQLVDLINALRNIGVEAISINGQRVIHSTGLAEENFQPPYEILVIGEKEVLENALTRRGGIIEQLAGAASISLRNDLKIGAR